MMEANRTNLFMRIYFCLIICVYYSKSECENGCSGHGRCTMYDMCICWRNWEGNDCANRVCQFGHAFASSPLGDLDYSGTLDGPEDLVIVNNFLYPYGTSESFPDMVDSDEHIIPQTAHTYAECSNVGICNRETGICECFDGFEGAACQKLKCPGSPKPCSGHGVCENLRNIAKLYNEGSTYRLWDQYAGRGCVCDKGFHGPDCSMRYCPYSTDPLYHDDFQTIQYPSYFLSIMTTARPYNIDNGFGKPGTFMLQITDIYEQTYFTAPITVPASCQDLVRALEGIPGNIIPKKSIQCYHTTVDKKNPLVPNNNDFIVTYPSLYKFYFAGTMLYTLRNRPIDESAGYAASYAVNTTRDPLLSGDLYYLRFMGNPGALIQPQIYLYGDGYRPTLNTKNGTLVAKSWTNGQSGYRDDFFSIYCGVRVGIMTTQGETYLWGKFRADKLFACLQRADFDPDNDYTDLPGVLYDRGTIQNPHLIKLVRQVTDYSDGYMIAAIVFDTSTTFEAQDGERRVNMTTAFRVLHPLHPWDDNRDSLFHVYATHGNLQMIQNTTNVEFDFGSNHFYTYNESTTSLTSNFFAHDGDLSCDSLGIKDIEANTTTLDCIDNGDYFIVLDPYVTMHNPPFINMYKLLSSQRADYMTMVELGDVIYNETLSMKYRRRHMLTSDLNSNWANNPSRVGGHFHIYRFVPSEFGTYSYVSECSNRGLCNAFEGICECFHGYSGGACQEQVSFAV